MSPSIARLTLAVLVLACTAAANEAPPIPSAERAKMLADFAAEAEALNKTLQGEPDAVRLLSRRGDRRLFLGRFPEAVADFERMIALDPSQDAPHWRLGIAYYFAGDFAKSARQFEKYHAYDARDRENGIWKFLAQVRTDGIEKARAGMLPYTQFDREPFPALYDMFAGKKTSDELFAEITGKGLAGDERVLFFANYYAGLHEELLGHRDKAAELLRKAVASPWGRTAEGGPAYMWQAARLHYETLFSASRDPVAPPAP